MTDAEKKIFDTNFEDVKFPCFAFKDFLESEHTIVSMDRQFGLIPDHPANIKPPTYATSMGPHCFTPLGTTYASGSKLYTRSMNVTNLRYLSNKVVLTAVLASLLDNSKAFKFVYEDALKEEESILADGTQTCSMLYQLSKLATDLDKEVALDSLQVAFNKYSLPIRARVLFETTETLYKDIKYSTDLNSDTLPFTIILEFGKYEADTSITVEKRFLLDPLSQKGSDSKKLNRLIMQMLRDYPTQNKNKPNISEEHLQKVYDSNQI